MTPTTQLLYWVDVLSMSVGALYFGHGAARAADERTAKIFQLNFFICLIASALYLVMATGYGAFETAAGGGTRTVWVRYVTWGLSTPLLLLVLTSLGRSRLPTVTALLGADVFMIATGLVATLVAEPYNHVWYLVSTGAYLAVVYLLLVPYRRQARETYPGKSTNRLRASFGGSPHPLDALPRRLDAQRRRAWVDRRDVRSAQLYGARYRRKGGFRVTGRLYFAQAQ